MSAPPQDRERVSRELIDQVTKQLVDEGKIIEAGWVGLKLMSVPKDAPAIQIEEMRNAFFAGAQHLLASLMSVLDPGEEPTADDLKRLDLIDAELKRFISEFAARMSDTPVERVSQINADMLAALKRLIADYEDVPDPTDSDGQAVFADARRAVAKAEGRDG